MPGGKRLDIAGDALADRRGDEIERGAGLARAALDDVDEPADAALPLLLGQALDLGIDRRADLLVEQALGVPGDIAEQKTGEEREDDEIDRRQLEGRRAEEIRQERCVCRAPRSRPASAGAVTDHVSRAADGVDQRVLEALVDLGAQAADMHVDDIGLRVEMIVPDVLQQHGARHHLAGVLHQIFEQAELARLQRRSRCRRA